MRFTPSSRKSRCGLSADPAVKSITQLIKEFIRSILAGSPSKRSWSWKLPFGTEQPPVNISITALPAWSHFNCFPIIIIIIHPARATSCFRGLGERQRTEKKARPGICPDLSLGQLCIWTAAGEAQTSLRAEPSLDSMMHLDFWGSFSVVGGPNLSPAHDQPLSLLEIISLN